MSSDASARAADAPVGDLIIDVRSLGKCYQIYEKPSHRLLQSLVGKRRKYFREFWALRGVHLQVRRGETLGIIGRNGSGKSTLLQLIAGTLAPTEGEVSATGRVAALLELGSGFNPDFTGRENAVLNATILGLSRQQIDAKLDAILAFADIGSFIDQPVRSYSSGMVMRLAFSVMAHVDADVLIIDEALAVGDAFFTQKCMRFLREFQKNGTLLFVSHDGGAVTGLCDRAIWLDKGQLCAEGDAKSVMGQYMEAFIREREGDASPTDPARRAPQLSDAVKPQRDVRQDLFERSTLRNDIVVPPFDPEQPSFGAMAAVIKEVLLTDMAGRRLPTVVGGEHVILEITATAVAETSSPIVGFYVKDRLGQLLFGDNTYLTHIVDTPISAGSDFSASFSFVMPRLQAGDYFVTAGIATGTQDEHVMQHWIHEALLLRSNGSDAPAGIIGIPMQEIRFEVNP
jgi:lipopolysaccharide transport system ATP-binding protein